MKINTIRFGTQDVDPETILTFPKGVPGFETCTRFKLFHEDRKDPAVHYLQAVDQADVNLPVVDPATFGLRYELNLTDEEAALVQAKEGDPLAVMLVTYKPQGEATAENVKVNINGPIIINPESRLGFQKVLVSVKTSVTVSA
jgi:flagellar assembly factor FliW